MDLGKRIAAKREEKREGQKLKKKRKLLLEKLMIKKLSQK